MTATSPRFFPAFKEWSLVCTALGTGRQSLLIRKGGIHEGRGGFAFHHRSFFLFPTGFHAQRERVKGDELMALEAARWTGEDRDENEVSVRLLAEPVVLAKVSDWDVVRKLDPLHVWTEEIIRERFDQADDPSLHIALVRVFRLGAPWRFPMEKRFGGCRSWVDVPEPPAGWRDRLDPVVGDPEFTALEAAVREAGVRDQGLP